MKVLHKTASLLLLACLLLTLSACGSSNTPSDAENGAQSFRIPLP